MEDLFGASSSDDEEQVAPGRSLQGFNSSAQLTGDENGLEDDLGDADAQPGRASGSQQDGTGPGTVRGLFGSDSEEDDDAGAAGKPPPVRPRMPVRGSDSDGEDDQAVPGRGSRQPEQPPGSPLHAEQPLFELPPENSVHMLRTTNIVGIQPTAFDPATYQREEEVTTDEAGRQRFQLANGMIRWRMRHLPDGRRVPESNARIVRWEDGSMQLMLGDEVLDVAQQDIRSNNSYLFVSLGTIFQGLGHLGSRLALRPTSTKDSGLHRRLREMVDKRNVKLQKVATHGGLANPELEKAKREAAEEARIKSKETLTRMQGKHMERAYGGARGGRMTRLTDNLLGEEQDIDAGDGGDYDDGLTADQRARMSLTRSRTLGDADAEAEAGQRLQAAKRGSRRSGPASKRRRRSGGSDDDEDDEDGSEEEEALEELPEEEEEEYEFSNEGSDDDGGASGGEEKRPPSKLPQEVAPPPPERGGVRVRKGVVLSSDEED